MQIIKYFAGFVGIAILFTIIFVRAGAQTGVSGGEQVGRIIKAGADGLSEIIRAAGGA